MRHTTSVILGGGHWVSVLSRHPKHQNRYLLLLELLLGQESTKAYLDRSIERLLHHPTLADSLALSLLATFHSKEFICALRGQDLDDSAYIDLGLEGDCPKFSGLWEHCRAVVLGTWLAAEKILQRKAQIAVHWAGGRHHAWPGAASGFCYVNDVAIAGIRFIQSDEFNRILYVDIDCHHGDAVEKAFEFAKDFFCISFHLFAKGFFPGTGGLPEKDHPSRSSELKRQRKEKNAALNIPLREGISDEKFVPLFQSTVRAAVEVICPKVIIIQCGVDGLAGDPTDAFNLSSSAFVECINILRNLKIPLLVLGGGGYDPLNTAKTWAQCTFKLMDIEIPHFIETSEIFLPANTKFKVPSNSGVEDKNDNAWICTLKAHIEMILNSWKGC